MNGDLRKVVLFMKLNYEVEWELDDEFINDLVNEVEEVIKNYPDSNIDDCIHTITEDNLSELDTYDCDHFNMDTYLNEVVEEVKERYFNRKNKNIPLPTIPTIPTIPAVPANKLHSGYIVKMDDFGGICIPINLRNLLKLEGGDFFEIFFDTDHNIILKKYHE